MSLVYHNRLALLAVTCALVLSACIQPSAEVPTAVEVDEQRTVACPKDLRICPDGTSLVRIPPSCEFPACPEEKISYKRISADDIDGLAGPFNFSVEIPQGWQVEAVPAIEAINIYDPQSEGQTNLDRSQIFIRHFNAANFLTLSTVTIHSRISTTTLDRPTVVYDIEKNSGISDFPSQPFWRNQRHIVTDIRETDDVISNFYVFGKRPELAQEIFDHFLYSLKFTDESVEPVSVEVDPLTISYDLSRVTKKEFGTYVTPDNSPVQPERFRGYHTGIDIEYTDTTDDITVTALTDGTVVRSGYVSGYGGMVALRHDVGGETYVTVYGHLDPASVVANGTSVKKGDKLGVLGEGYSDETDNERKHLHLSSHKGSELNIRGYVNTEGELGAWIDPVVLFDL